MLPARQLNFAAYAAKIHRLNVADLLVHSHADSPASVAASPMQPTMRTISPCDGKPPAHAAPLDGI